MLFCSSLLTLIESSLKREYEDFQQEQPPTKRMLVSRESEFDAANTLLSLSERPIYSDSNGNRDNLQNAIKNEATLFRVMKITRNISQPNNKDSAKVSNKIGDKEISLQNIEDKKVPEITKDLVKQMVKEYYENPGEKSIKNDPFDMKFDFHIWKNIDLYELKVIFQKNSYFSFDYIFLFLYRSKERVTFNTFSRNIRISETEVRTFLTDTVYDPCANPFEIANKFDDSYDEMTVYSRFFLQIFTDFQDYIDDFYQVLKPGTKGLDKFLRVYGYIVFNIHVTTINRFYLEEYIKHTIKEYYTFSDCLSLKILFPELQVLSLLIDMDVDLATLKRFYFYTAIFHLKFCFFKKIIGEEIRSMLYGKSLKNIFNCQYFLYFLISSKMLLQPLLLSFFKFHSAKIKYFVFANLVFCLQIISENLRNKMNLYPAIFFQSNDIHLKLEDLTILPYLKSNRYHFSSLQKIQIQRFPSIEKISSMFATTDSYKKILKILMPEDETSYLGLNVNELELLFDQKLITLLMSDFN